jgi:hypothetical protein
MFHLFLYSYIPNLYNISKRDLRNNISSYIKYRITAYKV